MPRIRTIKPEFWSHPIIGKQDDSTKLMAISLLNYADDEGYFHAEPNLIRGFCRPFDDNSTITRRCLDNLSKIGYISICENENYGPIGKVEKFLEHQRIDRPNDSKLRDYYSTSNRRTIDEQSTQEGKGKGKEKESNILMRNSKVFDLKYLIENIGPNYQKYDLAYYHESLLNWSDSKAQKRADWVATIRNAILKDSKENKAKLKVYIQQQLAR